MCKHYVSWEHLQILLKSLLFPIKKLKWWKTYLYPCKKQGMQCNKHHMFFNHWPPIFLFFLLLNELPCNLLHRNPDARNNLLDPCCHFRYSPFIDMKHISQSRFPEQWLLPLQLPYVRYNPQVFVFPEAWCSKDYGGISADYNGMEIRIQHVKFCRQWREIRT